jgi:hypothetical protein
MKPITSKQFVLYVVGVLLYIIFATYIIDQLQQHAKETFSLLPFYWVRFALYTILGGILATVLMKLNVTIHPFLPVALFLLGIIPLIMSLLLPLSMTTRLGFNTFFIRFFNYLNEPWLAIVGGALVIYSIILYLKMKKAIK